jgi:ATP-binding cassette subfamily B protein
MRERRVHKPRNGDPREIIHNESAKDLGGAIKKLIVYIGHYRASIICVCVLTVLSAIAMITGPKVLGQATDEMVKGLLGQGASMDGGIDYIQIGTILLQVGVLYLSSALFSYIQGWMMSGITTKVTYNLRRDIDKKIHSVPLDFYDTTTHGEILSRINNDVDTISQTLSQSLTQMISAFVTFVGIIIIMFTISWQLTLATLCVIPLTMAVMIGTMRSSQKHFQAQQAYLGQVNEHVEEMYGAHMVVSAFNGQKASQETIGGLSQTLYKSAWKANFLSGLMLPVTSVIGSLGYIAVCVLGGALAAGGSVTVGSIQAFIIYVRNFQQLISQAAGMSNVLQQTAAAAERVFEFLVQPDETPDEDRVLPPAASEEGISFCDVNFGYLPDKTVIHSFSAKIKPGQKVAIVGPTGAGKTTVIKLLMRFYDVNRGKILLDGCDIRLYKRDKLRSRFGMVLQDTWLFHDTIANNIRYGKLNATDGELYAAARAAQADHFVRTLPNGYHMALSEEVDNISQGQKQLLTIARAFLADPDILILDEATSNVDTRTEILIQKAMDCLMRGRTSFIIAHRLSTIRSADLILVMNEGDIVEQGNHEELLARNGVYAGIYNSQFQQ